MPLHRCRADLRSIVAALPADRTIVPDLPLMPGGDAYQNVLSQVVDGSGITRADVAMAFAGEGRHLDIFSLLPPHLNDRGYGYWFDAFRPEIEKIIDASLQPEATTEVAAPGSSFEGGEPRSRGDDVSDPAR